MKKNNVKDLVEVSIIASLYIVLTVLIEPLSYNGTQFRISEILMILCFFNRKYCISMIIGCLIANLWSPYLLWDMVFGTLATALAGYCMTKSKHLIVATLFPVLFNGLIVGAEIAILDKLPFGLMALSVALGEFVVVTVFGTIIFTTLIKNSEMRKLICAPDLELKYQGIIIKKLSMK